MRRGTQLREHILLAGKDVFIEFGYERASMDMVATRASTSKRSLYAHFETKENLFLAVVELVRSLFSDRVKAPADYADETVEAITLYCGRVQQLLLYGSILRACRMAAAEADRLPEASARYFDTFFGTPHRRLTDYLLANFSVSDVQASDLSDQMIGRAVYPAFTRALFGLESLRAELPDDHLLHVDVDLEPIRRSVQSLLTPLVLHPETDTADRAV